MFGQTHSNKLLLSRFVDREEELSKLQTYLNESMEGKGNLVFIVGEAGIGKTRLVNELGETGEEHRIKYLRGRCLYNEDADPYLPFIDAFRKYFKEQEEINGTSESLPMGLMGLGVEGARASDESISKIEDLIPMGLIPTTADKAAKPEGMGKEITKIDLQAERDRMFETLSQLIKRISDENPLILFIDDLQWADAASLQLFHYISRNVRESKVLLVGSYRPEDLKVIEGRVHPLTELLQRMSLEKLYTTITLERMSLEDISTMVKSMLNMEDIPDTFIKKLYEESEGNPFFVEEVLRSLIDEGVIDPHAYSWNVSRNLSELRMPTTIKDVISRRITRLDEKTKKMLMYASVIGNTFGFEVLHRATGMDEEELLDSLDRLIESKLVHEEHAHDEEIYKFDHIQVRAVIYDSLSKSRARLMHKRIGQIVEEVYSKRIDDVVFGLARHYNNGKVFDKAYRYCKMAGEKATKIFALDEAIEYYKSALSALEMIDEAKEKTSEKTELLISIADLSYLLGEWDRSQEFYKQGLKLAEEANIDKRKAECLRKIGHIERQKGNYAEANEVYEQSLNIYVVHSDPHGIADVHRGLGYVHWRQGEAEDAIEHYNQAVTWTEKTGDVHLRAILFIELGNVYNTMGRMQEGVEYYNKAIKELEVLGDYSELARAYNNLGDVHLQLAEWDKAIVYFELCKTASEKIGNKNMLAWALFNAAEAYANKGELDKAQEYCDRSLALTEALDDKIGMHGVFRNYGIIYRMRGEWDKSIENLNKAMTILEMLNIPYELGVVTYQMAETLKAMGDKSGAEEYWSMALDLFEEVGAAKDLEKTKKALEELKAGEGKGEDKEEEKVEEKAE